MVRVEEIELAKPQIVLSRVIFEGCSYIGREQLRVRLVLGSYSRWLPDQPKSTASRSATSTTSTNQESGERGELKEEKNKRSNYLKNSFLMLTWRFGGLSKLLFFAQQAHQRRKARPVCAGNAKMSVFSEDRGRNAVLLYLIITLQVSIIPFREVVLKFSYLLQSLLTNIARKRLESLPCGGRISPGSWSLPYGANHITETDPLILEAAACSLLMLLRRFSTRIEGNTTTYRMPSMLSPICCYDEEALYRASKNSSSMDAKCADYQKRLMEENQRRFSAEAKVGMPDVNIALCWHDGVCCSPFLELVIDAALLILLTWASKLTGETENPISALILWYCSRGWHQMDEDKRLSDCNMCPTFSSRSLQEYHNAALLINKHG
ncbi:hypothetical protein SDJN03_29352, partial [Cucurbita argyrosperma subsp. sororia]